MNFKCATSCAILCSVKRTFFDVILVALGVGNQVDGMGKRNTHSVWAVGYACRAIMKSYPFGSVVHASNGS